MVPVVSLMTVPPLSAAMPTSWLSSVLVTPSSAVRLMVPWLMATPPLSAIMPNPALLTLMVPVLVAVASPSPSVEPATIPELVR
ncbi:hypothetical protein NGUA15_03908 [Salmonella enterica]|nr:hypothetical protein NGUA15_03908 [Salmonella enterica]